jgi:serine/threonine protein kinase
MSERELFLAVLDLPTPSERAAYLDQACNGDPALRAKVEALLRSHDAAGSFLHVPNHSASDGATEGIDAVPVRSADGITSTLDEGGAHEHDDAIRFLAPPRRPDSLGRIGHYDVLEVLGKGGFGIVYRAFDDVLQRVVAVKVLAPTLATTSPARKRFLREARSAAPIQHENVVRIHETGEEPLPFLVMEFVPGETLQDRLDRTGPLDVLEVLRVGRQVAAGLAAAHERGLIHRDIKPSNILIDAGPQHQVKITDFGLARAADDASLTRSGVVAGTPMYMAPEQAKGETLDQRADLFSLGSVLYTMLTGRPPFRAANTPAVLKRVSDDTPRLIREVIPEVPEWLCRIVEKLHAKDPSERFQSAKKVTEVLADCEAQLKATGVLTDYTRIPGGRPRSRVRWKWAAAAALLLPLLAVGVYALTRPGDPPEIVDNGDPKPPDVVPVNAAEGWVQIFNGKDFTGWAPTASWNVKDGILSSKPEEKKSNLFTLRDDFANFHFRAEIRINDGGNSGIFFRYPSNLTWKPDVLEAQIHCTGADPIRTGSLWHLGVERAVKESLHQPDEWFTLEVIAIENDITIKVNGKVTTRWNDTRGKYVKGRLGIQLSSLTLVQFRKIEIKELPPSSPAVPVTTAHVLSFLAGNWKVDREEGDSNLPPEDTGKVGDMTFDFVANGTMLRGRGDLTTDLGTPHFLYSYDPKQGTLCRWAAWSGGGAFGPIVGSFSPDTRTVLWMHEFVNGGKSNVEMRFVDPDKMTVRLFRLDENDKLTRESRLRFTRVKGPVIAAEVPTDPKRPDEMKVLDRLVGKWRNELTLTSAASPDKVKTQKQRTVARAILGGRFIEIIDTDEDTNGADYSLTWYDPGVQRYRAWFFSGEGHSAELRGSWNAKTKTLSWHSQDKRLEGHYVLGDDNRREFQHLIKAADGKVLGKADAVCQRVVTSGPSTPLLAKPPFVVLAGNTATARTAVANLQDAVAAAQPGDTIEIRGNGPFVLEAVQIDKPLVLRAGAGFHPTLEHDRSDGLQRVLISSSSTLALEGLSLTNSVGKGSGMSRGLVHVMGGQLYVANCKFLSAHGLCRAVRSPHVEFRNCEFHSAWTMAAAIDWTENPPNGHLRMSNCVTSSWALFLNPDPEPMRGAKIEFSDNTLLGNYMLSCWSGGELLGDGKQPRPYHLTATNNVFQTGALFRVEINPKRTTLGDWPVDRVDRLAMALFDWKGVGNLVLPEAGYELWHSNGDGKLVRTIKGPEDWLRVWGKGDMKRENADLKLRDAVGQKKQLSLAAMGAVDFRLAKDSPGKGKGPGGRDLGADVDRVGPGAAYEAWKQTPEYQQWRTRVAELMGGS